MRNNRKATIQIFTDGKWTTIVELDPSGVSHEIEGVAMRSSRISEDLRSIGGEL